MSNKRFRSVDIIKGIAMIMVILVHYEQSFKLCKWFRYLQMGCPVFFVCSGFGIMCLIDRKYSGSLTDRKQITDFYFSRFKALAPGWYLAFIFILFTGRTMPFGATHDPLSIVINLTFLNGLFPFCNNNVMPGGWYIGTTVILYILTPFIVWLLKKFKNRRMFFITSSAAGMCVWALLLRIFRDRFLYNDFYYYFFLVHYPNYLLGIMLYFDLNRRLLDGRRIRSCLPAGLITLAAAFILFYSEIRYGNVLSSWATALSAYLFLYYLISTEEKHTESKNGDILALYGKNSYGIYLLHAFYAWTFVDLTEKVSNRLGFSIKNIAGFIMMIPVVLVLCCFTGVIFNKAVKSITRKLWNGKS